jgi:predicted amidohydrolase YtcJ
MLIRDAEVDGRRVDIACSDGLVTAVGTALDDTGHDVVEAKGAALLPGLHDHHLHLAAMAAARHSVRCGPPDVRDRAELVDALNPPGHGWVRALGYHESVAGPLDRDRLDEMCPLRPLRVQHRSGALWMCNSVALDRLGISDHLDGRLWRRDDWLADRLAADPTARPDLDFRSVGADLARLGITGVTDATPDVDERALDTLTDAVTSGAIPQRVMLLGAADDVTSTVFANGPRKIVLADSGLPDYDELRDAVADAHKADRAVAVHCVSAAAAALFVAALDDIGAIGGDRMEHGAVLDDAIVARLVELGVAVVTQPSFVHERGDDYLRDMDSIEQPLLYRYATLRVAGLCVAPSSDAPYADVDPWRAITNARERRSTTGRVIGPAERVSTDVGLQGYLSDPTAPGRTPRRIRIGSPADLCLLDVPLHTMLDAPAAGHVRMTVVRGEVVYAAG